MNKRIFFFFVKCHIQVDVGSLSLLWEQFPQKEDTYTLSSVPNGKWTALLGKILAVVRHWLDARSSVVFLTLEFFLYFAGSGTRTRDLQHNIWRTQPQISCHNKRETLFKKFRVFYPDIQIEFYISVSAGLLLNGIKKCHSFNSNSVFYSIYTIMR